MSKFGFREKIDRMNEHKKKINEEMAEASRDYFVRNFDDHSFDGKSWVEGGKDYHDLDNTGALRSALVDSISDVDESGFKILVNSDYAIYQQEGTATIPARPFVGNTDELIKIQKDIINKGIEEIFKS
jgi:phage gpG-like protein